MNNTEPDYPAANPGPDPVPLPYQDVPALPPAVPQPVLYLPVKGPYPYNTMVVVHSYTVAEPSWFPILDDSVYRYSDLYQTGFRFPGYDPRTASQIAYQHSTIASLRTLQLSTHDQYTAAVDQVDDAFFDDTGVWTIKLNIALQIAPTGDASDLLLFDVAISSWILCYLPPPQSPAPPPPPGQQSQRPRPSKRTTR
jgi:hypothetical protein